MYGAIMGDIVGSRFEFDRGNKTKDIKLFTDESVFTDDTVMTVAVARALLDSGPDSDEGIIKKNVIISMKNYGRMFPDAGYGGRFIHWLFSDETEPYGSYGNGSAMRVSPAGWLYDSIERICEVARWTAEVTHNHPEGVKGAESVAAVIYLSRNGYDKKFIRKYVGQEFGYDLSRTCDEIRPAYHHVESCQETVPEAMTAFLEGADYTDAVKTAVSLGGDCDTLTDITAAMAEAYYGMPEIFIAEVDKRLPQELLPVVHRFNEIRQTICAMKRDYSKHEDMPKQREVVTFNRKFTDREVRNLRRGNVPKQMEDKWFFYMKRNRLYAYRSWTGYLIFVIEFDFETGIHKVTINRDPEQYNSQSAEDDIAHINDVLDWWTKDHYDFYGHWLSDTVDALKASGQME